MKTIAAFFDIDGTLYREALIAEVFKKLIKYEIIEERTWFEEVKPEYEKWDIRIGNYDNYLLKMAEIYVRAIKGLHKSQVEFIAKQVVSQKGDRVYTYTRDRIKWHKERGHKIITISGSPLELVKEMSLKHGFDDYRGAKYLLKGDIYTGEFIPMWDSNSKRKAISDLSKLYNIDLSKSYAYGDTSGDLTMLDAVSYPTCINPTRELLQKILLDEPLGKKINIVVERKDMIYKLNMNCIKSNI
ncbi:haloacid dehalogenase [Clostridium pasteurianum DSM 525 = ATCC 6013]|uniref:phosphoserine phosphatase n=1 Tax=Clostridium pasteurianum DSM 525 = ATCC 6013 TaxID=1262449 RepID=A0A0H3IYU7_CLOPA|nr:HAD-IB family hydrolase [Clostridium pasteurianum]AJA46184.1 haloacid dehalogenase [Clostridium pasteurianum DSM 525 = ATCC 6013]AJA50172.1 haloacid dehalogenase [Clostridium pasteurianum DSM 525 = ATCC 6013]AOZ73643.1 haloacid dehalogenase [Clostridium pasteurianum DSM 525 = ATCC 6013]AOZ77440.1 haloacid dehalogenase [Clostridium pasteurianum]ELP57445.1 Phosphoserine phosphatase related protein [Clostridium pasteurianum DSM 525 = ATCC 6013]